VERGRLNWELKASDPDPGRTLAAALAAGASDCGEFRQDDTYFWCPSGRLKLRREQGRAELIHYERRDERMARVSRYSRLEVSDPEQTEGAYARHLGVLRRIGKTRRLLAVGNVRIHLDAVDGEGRFVEIEAVVPEGADAEAEARKVRALQYGLGIADSQLKPRGYAEIVAAGARR
jgi:predicted adenylyl cyclase CyaB